VDLPVVPDHPVRWTANDAVLVLLGTQLTSAIWAVAMVATLYHGAAPDPLTTVALVVLNLGLWAGYGFGSVVVARTKGAGPRLDFGVGWRWFDGPTGLVAGVALQAVVLPLLYKPITWLVDGDPGASAKSLVKAVNGPGDAVVLALSTLVMAPLVEELFFRGLLLRALQRRFGPAPAVVASSAVFALVHWQILAFPGLFLFAVVSAGLALWSGRLGPSWALHVGFNLTTLVLLGFR
jgi:membrane protease YdiL (CAAX protease family)